MEIASASNRPEVKQGAIGEFNEIFRCRFRLSDSTECGWNENKNRSTVRSDPDILWEYAEDYAIAYQKHIMRHLLPTHFPPCRRNRNEWTAEYWREQNEKYGVRLGPAKARPPRGKPMPTPPGSIERYEQMMTDEMQKAIPADCTSVEEAAKLGEAYIEADWKACRDKDGYIRLRNSDGDDILFGPDGHPAEGKANGGTRRAAAKREHRERKKRP